MKTHLSKLCIPTFLLLFAFSMGADRLVPSQYPTIQSAVNDADDGDTIIVSNRFDPYQENVTINAKTLTITSLFNGTDPSVIDQTVIRGSISVDDAANLLLYGLTINNEGLEGVLCNGLTDDASELNLYWCRINGYVHVTNSDCWIRNCTFTAASENTLMVTNPDRSASDVECTNCLFCDNGGQYEVYLDNVNEHFESCSFLGAAGYGGYNRYGSFGVIYITGNGVVWEDSFVNCIFAPGISVPLVTANRDIYSSNCCIAQSDVWLYSNQYTFADAITYAPSANGYIPWIDSSYHMQLGSPCINAAGFGGGVDVFGNPRMQQGKMDIGAEETPYESNNTWYVDAAVSSSGNGRSSYSPFKTITEAVASTGNGDTIMVAPGVYAERITVNNQSNIKILSDEDEGISSAERTTITGAGTGRPFAITGSTVTIKGFTLTGGSNVSNGAGLFTEGSGKTTLLNCIIKGNNAASIGGGMYAAAPVDLINCVIAQNTAPTGGGLYLLATTNLYNCTVYGNTATASGGGLYNNNVAVSAYNSIFWGNTASSLPDYNTCNRYDCYIQQDSPGAAPNFMSAPENLRLRRNSVCIDMGLDSNYDYCVSNPPEKDVAGLNRKYDLEGSGDASHVIDIGAYEYQSCPVIFVNAAASSDQYDGSSWLEPYKYLQDALQAARDSRGEVGEIWVAEGTYYPDVMKANAPNGNNLRVETFALIEGVKMYGGFQGVSTQFPSGETSIQDRSSLTAEHPSVLSGDIDPTGSNDSFQVVTGTVLSNATVLDRFTITQGQSDSVYGYTDGAGMILNNAHARIVDCVFMWNTAEQKGGALFNNMSSPKLVRCAFHDNSARFGAAIFNSCQSSPEMIDCDFINNTAQDGGAVFNHSQSSPLIERAVFRTNQATGTSGTPSTYGYGGAVYNVNDSNPEIKNSVFLENTARYGGGMYNYFECDPQVINCTITLNQSTAVTYGGGIQHAAVILARDPSKTRVVNSILWNNKTNTGASTNWAQYFPTTRFDSYYNCVTLIGPNSDFNIADDPLFVNGVTPTINRTHTDGLMLQTGGNQQCIDSGSNNDVDSYADVALFKRIQGVNVDRGAYEVGNEMPSEVLYAGVSSGNAGLVYRYLDGGQWECIVNSPSALGTSVDALCFYDGDLYAGGRNGSVGEVWKYLGNQQWIQIGTSLGTRVWDLEVCNDTLYAGTAAGDRLYRYMGNDQWQAVPFSPAASDWSGCSSLYEYEGVLYLGNLGDDNLGHLETSVVEDIEQGGSCIWDHQSFQNRLYASALGGITYRTAVSNYTDWSHFLTINPSYAWEMEVLGDVLYISSGGFLVSYDGNSQNQYQEVWNSPGTDIISMEAGADYMAWGMQQTGQIYYTENGSNIELITNAGGINPNQPTNTNVEALLVIVE